MTPIGFPHSEIPGSKLACSSPRLIAACHVLHRRHVPRHPPCALSYLTSILTAFFSATQRWISDSAQSAYKSTLQSPRLVRLQCEKILVRSRLGLGFSEKSLPFVVVKRVSTHPPIPVITKKPSQQLDFGTLDRTKLVRRAYT